MAQKRRVLEFPNLSIVFPQQLVVGADNRRGRAV